MRQKPGGGTAEADPSVEPREEHPGGRTVPLAARLLELRRLRRAGRAVFVTDLGRREIPSALGVAPANLGH